MMTTYKHAATLTPNARTGRTFLQAVIGFLIAVPVALKAVDIPSKYDGYVTAVVGICAALVVLVSAVQNALEGKSGNALGDKTTP